MNFITLHKELNGEPRFVNATLIAAIEPVQVSDGSNWVDGSRIDLCGVGGFQVRESPEEVLRQIRDVNVVDCTTSLKGLSE